MILKAGTYKFNDVLSVPNFGEGAFEFNINGNVPTIDYSDDTTFTKFVFEIYSTYSFLSLYLPYHDTNANIYIFVDDSITVNIWTSEINPPYEIELSKDTEIDDTFGTWFISSTNYNEVNAKPLAEITYNGETIAQLNAGETATLKCKDLPMASDVVVKVAEKIDGAIITSDGQYFIVKESE